MKSVCTKNSVRLSAKKYYFCIIKRITLILVLTLLALSAHAQFTDSTTGLLSAPSADMNASGTFMITNNFLNEHLLPRSGWDYSTFGYGFGVTFWSRLEVSYVCTIFYSKWSPRYPSGNYRFDILYNQDRHFTCKILLLKEGDFGKDWMPALAVGISDPVTGEGSGQYIGSDVSGTDYGNGYFNRYYIVATKHIKTGWGPIGTHIGYQYSKRVDWNRKGVIAAVDWRPVWLQNRWFSPKFVLEYDANTVNFGFLSSIWDDRFEAMFELQNFQWVSFGLRFKLKLKGSE